MIVLAFIIGLIIGIVIGIVGILLVALFTYK